MSLLSTAIILNKIQDLKLSLGKVFLSANGISDVFPTTILSKYLKKLKTLKILILHAYQKNTLIPHLKMKICWSNASHFFADLVTFAEEIPSGKLRFLWSANKNAHKKVLRFNKTMINVFSIYISHETIFSR